MKNNNEETKRSKKEHATRYSQIIYKYFTTTKINIRQGYKIYFEIHLTIITETSHLELRTGYMHIAPSRWVELLILSGGTAAYSRKIDFTVLFFFLLYLMHIWK
jgi:hypothetical protein